MRQDNDLVVCQGLTKRFGRQTALDLSLIHICGTIWISSGISGWLCGRGGAGMSERHGEESRI